uniref:Uncharacterized protein n=1 Tax=Arundo donax TaxID=35708 RepID=A0A0A8Z6M2_ARUDO
MILSNPIPKPDLARTNLCVP